MIKDKTPTKSNKILLNKNNTLNENKIIALRKTINQLQYCDTRLITNAKLKERARIIKAINNIETEFPDDDGIPFELSVEEFKQELLKIIGETK